MGCTRLANYKLIAFDKIPSTQTYAHDLIANGRADDHVAIMADVQTAGRGRYRRTWISNNGNLYVSFLYKCPERDSRISYAIAVAVAETLSGFGLTPSIKWPNDILIDSKKICGILIEYSGRFMIVGIGINIKSCPSISEYGTTCVNKYAPVTREELLGALMKNLDKWMRADFASVRARWMDMAIGINNVVRYRGGDAVMMGINENGALILRCGAQYVMVYGDEIAM